MKNFKLFILVLLSIFYNSCSQETKEFGEIKKLSKIDFPEKSEVIFYNDDYEGLLVFQLRIDFSKNDTFLKDNHFSKYNKNTYLHTDFSHDELSIKQINNHFKDKIYINDDIQLLTNDNHILVTDSARNILWGYINY